MASFRQLKILAIKFKYLGDIAVVTPSLRALREQFPGAELHVLVAEEAGPILQHLPWINRVWKLPRKRGKMSFRESWPVIRALRAERFDRSVDFVGNDRGAILSLLIGAKLRLGLNPEEGFFGRARCYHETVEPLPRGVYEPERDFALLGPWQIPRPSSFAMEVRPDPALADWAREEMREAKVLCHLSTSQPKKEWPPKRWAELYDLARGAGIPLIYSTGASPRELECLAELRKLRPEVEFLPAYDGLAEYIAVLSRARLYVAGDTGPLHFAAGLGLPTLSLFGPSLKEQWAPRGDRHLCLASPVPCPCSVHASVCSCTPPCMENIKAEDVLKGVQSLLDKKTG